MLTPTISSASGGIDLEEQSDADVAKDFLTGKSKLAPPPAPPFHLTFNI